MTFSSYFSGATFEQLCLSVLLNSNDRKNKREEVQWFIGGALNSGDEVLLSPHPQDAKSYLEIF